MQYSLVSKINAVQATVFQSSREKRFSSVQSKENFKTLRFVSYILQMELFLYSVSNKYGKQSYLLIRLVISLN